MQQYIIRRLLIAIPVLIGVTILNFAFIRLAPGDPVSAMIDPRLGITMSQSELAKIRAELGLDQPLPAQYLLWLKQIGSGKLGYTIKTGEPVIDVIKRRIGPTLQLTVTALILSIITGIPLGIYSALRQYSRVDYLLTVGTFAGISVPAFFLALLFMYAFAVKLDFFPTSGYMTIGAGGGVLDRLHHMVLPATVMALGHAAGYMRYARSSMLDVMQQDYVTTARAKGLKEKTVIGLHAFRNALLPLITIIGLSLPGLINGSVLIETVFNWPGMALFIVQATMQRDYQVIMTATFLIAILVLVSNLIADIAYAVADPRIRYD